MHPFHRFAQLPDLRRFGHLRLLLFWPLFSLTFYALEHLRPPVYYHPMRCALDAMIPFCRWFVIPYVFWFLFVAGMLAWTALRDVPAFRRMMKFIILTYSFALLTYWLFPNCQHLRPVLSDNDVLTRLVSMLYRSDTNTNVCPSIHVIGSLAVWLAARDMKQLPALLRKYLIPAMAILISVSTVFLKQHSALDILAALLVCAAAYPLVYRSPARRTAPLVVQAMEMEQSRSPQL